MVLSERVRYNSIIKSTKMRQIIWAFLAQRDGAYCQTCQKTSREVELIIHHIDGNPRNNDPANLNLQCRSDNEKLIWAQRVRYSVSTPQSVCVNGRNCEEGVRAEGDRSLSLLDRELSASSEIRLSREKEPVFRSYVMGALLQGDGASLSVEEAVNAGAEFARISTVTARRYLAKMTSSEGALCVLDHGKGMKLVVAVKSHYWSGLVAKESMGAKK